MADQEFRYRGTPHTYNMCGVMIADMKLARMLQVAVASPIPLVAPVKPWEPEYPDGPIGPGTPTPLSTLSCVEKEPRL
eukprot:1821079-Pyramimonas_sp.AAC.1